MANTDDITIGQTAAFQPAWAEYKRLPRFVTGQMRTQTLKDLDPENPDIYHLVNGIISLAVQYFTQ